MTVRSVQIGDIWEYHTGYVDQPPFRAVILEILKEDEEQVVCRVWLYEKGFCKQWSWFKDDHEEMLNMSGKMVLFARAE